MSVLWNTPNGPYDPANTQWGSVTPNCMRPSRATSPPSVVLAWGTPTTEGEAGADCTTIPPAGVGRAMVTRSVRPVPVPVTVASPAGSQRRAPVVVTRPTRNRSDGPASTGTSQARTVSVPPKYHRREAPAARAKVSGDGLGLAR